VQATLQRQRAVHGLRRPRSRSGGRDQLAHLALRGQVVAQQQRERGAEVQLVPIGEYLRISSRDLIRNSLTAAAGKDLLYVLGERGHHGGDGAYEAPLHADRGQEELQVARQAERDRVDVLQNALGVVAAVEARPHDVARVAREELRREGHGQERQRQRQPQRQREREAARTKSGSDQLRTDIKYVSAEQSASWITKFRLKVQSALKRGSVLYM